MMRLDISLVNARKLLWLLTSPKTYTQIANWPLYLADYLGLVHGEYTIKLRNHLKITLLANNPDKWPLQEVLLRDDYQLLSLQKDPPKTVIDLGANIGICSLLAKVLFPKAHVYAFEPFKQYFRFLETNIKANHLERSISAFPLACYSQRAVRKINSGRKQYFAHLVGPEWIYGYKQAISLEDILKRNRIALCDLLKIDVEGAEYDILYSLSPSAYRRIKKIHLEYHNLDPKADFNGSSLKLFLEKNHFDVTQSHIPFQKIGMLFATNRSNS